MVRIFPWSGRRILPAASHDESIFLRIFYGHKEEFSLGGRFPFRVRQDGFVSHDFLTRLQEDDMTRQGPISSRTRQGRLGRPEIDESADGIPRFAPRPRRTNPSSGFQGERRFRLGHGNGSGEGRRIRPRLESGRIPDGNPNLSFGRRGRAVGPDELGHPADKDPFFFEEQQLPG
jgi:hypothetical protein